MVHTAKVLSNLRKLQSKNTECRKAIYIRVLTKINSALSLWNSFVIEKILKAYFKE